MLSAIIFYVKIYKLPLKEKKDTALHECRVLRNIVTQEAALV